MKKSRFAESQIIGILRKPADGGVAGNELWRKYEINAAT